VLRGKEGGGIVMGKGKVISEEAGSNRLEAPVRHIGDTTGRLGDGKELSSAAGPGPRRTKALKRKNCMERKTVR